MEASRTARVLVVAHKTAATPALIAAVRQRAAHGQTEFHLLVPDPHVRGLHADPTAGEQVLALALPLLSEAAGAPVDGTVSRRHDPMDAIEETLREGDFHEIILSTLPHSVSRWLHVDLPHRVAHLGLPLTTVIAREPRHPAARPEPLAERRG
jgi:hypothetical protein